MRWSRLAVTLVVSLVATAGCGSMDSSPSPSSASGAHLRVVATTTVFADLVAQVGGPRVDVESLVPKGGEVHTFDPTPSDVRRIAAADLIFLNGLGLDAWLEPLIRDAGTSAPVVALADDLAGVTYLGGEGGAEVNPHLWLDVDYAGRYVQRIRDALSAADPEGAATHEAGADTYLARLTELDAWARARLAAIPARDRLVVTFHDAFPYFAAAYGLEIVGTVIDAPGQDPSAGEIGRLVTTIRESGVRAVLAEAQFSPDLAQTIADETGTAVVTDLYTGSLGDPPIDTFEGLIRWDVDRIAAGLTGG